MAFVPQIEADKRPWETKETLPEGRRIQVKGEGWYSLDALYHEGELHFQGIERTADEVGAGTLDGVTHWREINHARFV